MNTPLEGFETLEAFSAAPPPPHDGEAGPADSSQEINERRARVENAELLQHLRGL
jgi:hypothetical protein